MNEAKLVIAVLQGKEYKKSEDSPELLLRIEKEILVQKCPMFRDFYCFMQTLNTN